MAGGDGAGKSGSATATRSGGVVLPQGVSLETASDARFYSFSQGGSQVVFQVTDLPRSRLSTVNFSVNGSLNRRGEPSNRQEQRDNLAVALQVRNVMRADVASRPNNFQYMTMAETADGLGAARTRLYARAGFTTPRNAGDSQYAYVRNGRLVPGIAPPSG
jgi:hypothetical protein